jgi:hypothetical protein
MKLGVFVSILAMVLVAGCAGKTATKELDSTAPLTADPALVTEDLGAIRGTILDEEQAPVVGATVGIRGAGNASNTISSQDGKFSFSHLAPGAWEVVVGAAFFEGAVKRATVTAGAITDVNIALRKIPETNSTELYLVQNQKRGFINLAYSFPWTTGATLGGSLGQGLPNEQSHFPLEYDAKLGLKEVVLEVVWQPSAPSGERLQVSLCSEETVKDSQNNCFNVPDSPQYANRVEGGSPLVLRDAELPLADIPNYVIAVGDGGGTRAPLTLQQTFDLYITTCYGQLCPAEYQMRPG